MSMTDVMHWMPFASWITKLRQFDQTDGGALVDLAQITRRELKKRRFAVTKFVLQKADAHALTQLRRAAQQLTIARLPDLR